MKNKIFILSLMLLCTASSIKLNAQCTETLAAPATTYNGPNQTYAIRTAQSFTPTCNGQVTSITFVNRLLVSDDFRGSGYGLRCNLKTATGTLIATGIWPNGKDTTDQWYLGNTITSTFDCSNVTLSSGTQYIWELFEIEYATQLSNFPVLLLPFTSTSTYAGGTYIKDGVVQAANDIQGWTVNMSNGNIATANSSKTQTIIPCSGFYNATPQLICNIKPGTTNGISGSTTAKVWLETTQPTQYVKRHYEITPATNATTATGTVTLYFTQIEFNDFNAVNTLKLPTGTADATGKANLLIEKRPGISSDGSGLPGTYTGTPVTIDPVDADIVYNTSLSRWEVSFATTGFSGFFVKTLTTILPLKWLNVSGNINTQKQATINWQVQENNVAIYVIEKSTDGRTFNAIATISSKGDGTNNYNYTDAAILNAVEFYRIKQIDFDGRTSYSSIIKLSNYQISTLTIYPNPVKDIVTLSGASIGSKATLTDISGKQLLQINITQAVFTLNMSTYKSGVYILKTHNGVTQKIIKE